MGFIRFGENLPFPESSKQLEHCGFSLATLYKLPFKGPAHFACGCWWKQKLQLPLSAARQRIEFSLAGFWLVRGLRRLFAPLCVFFSFSFCLSEKGQRFLCGQGMKAKEGALLYKASSRAALLAPLPQLWVTAGASNRGVVLSGKCQPRPQPCKHLLLCSQILGDTLLSPRLAQTLLGGLYPGNGDPGVAWRRLGPRDGARPWASLANGTELFDREKKNLYCAQRLGQITQLVPTLLFLHSLRQLCKYFFFPAACGGCLGGCCASVSWNHSGLDWEKH